NDGVDVCRGRTVAGHAIEARVDTTRDDPCRCEDRASEEEELERADEGCSAPLQEFSSELPWREDRAPSAQDAPIEVGCIGERLTNDMPSGRIDIDSLLSTTAAKSALYRRPTIE